MRVLLVNPNLLNPPVFPVGMEYAAEHLIKQGKLGMRMCKITHIGQPV
jgi:hypothetical protein